MNLSILIAGPPQVGKKSYLNRLITGEFRTHLTTNVHTLKTSHGPITITYGVSSTCTEGYDGYILMYDVRNPETRQFIENTPGTTVFVANKCDKNITVRNHHSVSAMWNKGLYDPILEILRAEFGQHLQFVENDPIVPPSVNVRVPLLHRIFRL